MYKALSLAAVLMVMASPAAAQTTPASPPATNASAESDALKIVCKKEEAIGTRLGAKKVCLTVQEWKDLAEANREHTEKAQRESGFRSGN